MDFQSMDASVNETGTVLPVSFSQDSSSVGCHWLRISFSDKYLAHVSDFVSNFYGDFDQDGFGLWSYDSRFAWAGGVSLNYDEDKDRSERVHKNCITLDCPGSALDQLTASDQQLLFELCNAYEGKCTRIDIYFDDYRRIVAPSEVYEVAKRGDFSGFRSYGRRERGDRNGITYDEISFGRRGSYGSGSYLRCYDKKLESNGEFDCVRWEVEFTQRKADIVFKKLADASDDLDAFATLCGSLIAGSITFVHRNGDPNISRLSKYQWWDRITDILGDRVSIRVARTKDSVTGKMLWIKRCVAPSLACLERVFVTDRDFFRWLFDVTHEGGSRMNPYSEQIARENEHSMTYRWSNLEKEQESKYDLSMSQL